MKRRRACQAKAEIQWLALNIYTLGIKLFQNAHSHVSITVSDIFVPSSITKNALWHQTDPPLNPNIKPLQELKSDRNYLYVRYVAMRKRVQDVLHGYHQHLGTVLHINSHLSDLHQCPTTQHLVAHKAPALINLGAFEGRNGAV